MSNRSLLELNHDYCPRTLADACELGFALRHYMRAADPNELPPGVVRKHYRHHSDPDPMALLDALAGDLRAAQARERELVAALEPLAEIARRIDDRSGKRLEDNTGLWTRQSTTEGENFTLTLGHARAARAALKWAGVE
jgi:hypothetical protein